MMLLRRFVELFGRARPADMSDIERTRLRFSINEMPLALHSVEFDLAANMWTIKLQPPSINDETISQAIEALRTPNYVYKQVPNAVRQSLADMIELLMVRGRGEVQ